LWELKSDPQPKLTEGQMISSWNATDVNKNNSITLAEFQAYAAGRVSARGPTCAFGSPPAEGGAHACGRGLDICYENHFFAAENGVAIPESVMITQGLVTKDEDLSNVRVPHIVGRKRGGGVRDGAVG
jgi:hypothetical protein